MKSLLASLLLLSSLESGATEGAKPPRSYEGGGHPTIAFEKPDLTDPDAKAVWRMWMVLKGTRSEGLHGAIIENKTLVEGSRIGDTRTINGKDYVWCGTWDSRKQLFSLSGWLPKSEDRVSQWLDNTKKAEVGGTGKPATGPESKPERTDKPQPRTE